MQSDGSLGLAEPALTGNGAEDTPGSSETWVLFVVDEQKYGLLISEVERIVRAVEVKPLPQSPPHVLGIINMQGRILPVIDLRRCLQRPPRDIQPEDHFIIAAAPMVTVVLPVDAALGSLQVVAVSAAPDERTRDRYLRKIIPLGPEVLYALDLERLVFGDETPEDSALVSALAGMETE
ncbi:MAG: chemotaxis protein CheW [Actinobacteria bacterium]|nr:chemotaxis protein CheW [Actinomycetota bacterium]